jgi:hypothetical protein
MSEIKVNKLSPRTNCGTVQLGDSGDTITIPAGATITNNGTAAGFGATGAASWDTTVKTASFTGVAGVGYFVNTTSGAITVTLPASPDAGAVVAVKDYANTFDTNNVTLARNGSNIGGQAIDATLSTEGVAVTLVYVDATKGWLVTDSGLQDDAPTAQYIVATGGTITCCGDYKIHTFTGPGTFTVCSVGNPTGSDSVDYLVVAGGGSGGTGNFAGGGGGGAGGFREGFNPGSYTASPLATTALPVSVSGYPITVGGGGPGATTTTGVQGARGSNSVFSSIISTGGGGGNGADCGSNPLNITSPGGSGGGASSNTATPFHPNFGTGNTPPVSPPQGNDGGDVPGTFPQAPNYPAGGGGGAGAAGQSPTNFTSAGGFGGAGIQTNIDGNSYYWSGGGGGNAYNGTNGGAGGIGGGGGGGTSPGPAGSGSGGAGGGTAINSGSAGGTPNTQSGGNGGTNTGGGGGANGGSFPAVQGAGGSGIVIIRYKFQ